MKLSMNVSLVIMLNRIQRLCVYLLSFVIVVILVLAVTVCLSNFLFFYSHVTLVSPTFNGHVCFCVTVNMIFFSNSLLIFK